MKLARLALSGGAGAYYIPALEIPFCLGGMGDPPVPPGH